MIDGDNKGDGRPIVGNRENNSGALGVADAENADDDLLNDDET
eukprot:CAMPEP_0175058938 /NCGR_PEP_ID=MMETSP0052_2-20121109/12136_1 /TAXON_ID=51329 ORGANISM="Polytomella parva, Strain SAG 63-3" /NCGR_SAMPLE_ID=MMETSP0052_2 /ASSEMBLY_ACC=CAM_ASM_000194 /LENGTH=42 /DNA_ID= /DNA_START= /DNA_END= /DNA_ORIENTATION=